MEIKIKDGHEFQRLLDGLAHDIVDAHIHYKLFQDLNLHREEFQREFVQSWTFWSLTFQAHIDAVMIRLCRAYDQYASGSPSLNLRNLLHTVEANLHLFETESFKQRLSQNPFVESLAESSRIPSGAQLSADLSLVNLSNPLVKNLTVWRHNYVAHRSPAQVLDNLLARFPLPYGDIEILLSNALEIVNRYSGLFIANYHSKTIVGHSDFLNVLKAVKAQVDNEEAKIEEEIQRDLMRERERKW